MEEGGASSGSNTNTKKYYVSSTGELPSYMRGTALHQSFKEIGGGSKESSRVYESNSSSFIKPSPVKQ
jgi:hypothetical protein